MTDRIAVNLLWCVPGDVGGSEEYLVRQLTGLAEEDPDLAARCDLFVVDGFAAAHPDLAQRYPLVTAPFNGASRARRIAGETGWFRRASRPYALRHHGGGTAPVGARRPYVLTVHDLQYRTFPTNFSRRKRAWFAAMMRPSARRAARITTPSEFVRSTVVDAFGVAPERVDVVVHGVDVPERVTSPEDLRRRYPIGDGPILVYPAVTHPHKNHRLLVELLEGPWRERTETIVCTGGRGSAHEVLVAAPAGRLVHVGRVDEADRDGLVAMAEALVFPSLYEGFGAPLIEAMALGTPILAGDTTAIPEVVGAAGVLRPATRDAWADGLDAVAARREELIAAGRERAQRYRTATSGDALARTYRAVLGCA